ncbi:MAG: molybdopterin-dependent oxidoreductase [Ilumatobacteraceae bacterium]
MPRDVLGTCHHDCPDSCGWIATVDDEGRAVRLRGNPDHPYSRGELCPKVNRMLDRVYSPDRILHPLIRTGAKGAGEFRRATWDEALGTVAERWTQLIATHGGETLLPWVSAGTQGVIQMSSLDQRLFGRLGTSRTEGSICGAVAYSGATLTMGSPRASDPMDVRHSDFIVLWGTNTRLTNRHLWPFVEAARARGAEVVVIDPMRTITADSADWFLQPLPGSDVALVLGVIHVLIRDDLCDEAYIDQYTNGFPALARVAAEWTPERTAAETGLAAEDVVRFAHRYGSTPKSFIRTLIGAEHREHGTDLFRLLPVLPSLTGSWRHLGGGYAQSTGVWAEAQVDGSVFGDVPRTTRTFPFSDLAGALTDETLDPAIHALMIWNGNPAVSLPNSALLRRGLARDDLFTVVSEHFVTDTARFADVVFPATTQLEHVDVVESWGHLYLGWNEPAIAPLGEAVSNTELFRRLATAMGFDDPALQVGDEDLIRAAVHDLDLAALRAQGWMRYDIPEPLLPYAEGGFGTRSGRIRLELPAAASIGLDPVPHPRATAEGTDAATRSAYPLVLLTPKRHTRFLNTSYSPLPGHGDREGGPCVELDVADATARGLAEGDLAEVYNDRARLRLPVRISDRLRPGVAAVPWGWWSAQHPDGGVANDLTNVSPTRFGGGASYHETLVEVAAAGS